MICGGSPCQDFSVAGKQKGSIWTCKDCGHEYNPLTVHWIERDKCPNCHSENIEKTRSSLLVEYLRVIRANKPNFGMYENVKNIVGKQFKDTFKMFTDELNEYGYNVYWKVLNAKDYGIPQNRERVYLIFIKKELDNGKFVFPEGFDSGIRLRDIIEDVVDEKFYLPDEKCRTIIEIAKNNSKDNENELKQIGYINNYNGDTNRVYDNNIARTLKAEAGGGGAKTGWYKADSIVCEQRCDEGIRFFKGNVCGALRTIDSCGDKRIIEVLGNVNPSGKGMNGNVFSEEGLAPTLTTNKGEGNKIAIRQTSQICQTTITTETETSNVEPKERFFRQAINTFENSDAKYGDTIDAFNERVNKSGYSPTLTTRPEGFKTAILPVTSNLRIRKLTPKECFRLMGFDDSAYEATSKVVSNSQMYKQTGNSIVVDVLYYILVELYKAMPYLFEDLRLSSFFSGIGAFEIALNRLYKSINSGNFTNPQVE